MDDDVDNNPVAPGRMPAESHITHSADENSKFNSAPVELSKTDSVISFYSPMVGHTVKSCPRIRRTRDPVTQNVKFDPVNRTSEVTKDTMSVEQSCHIQGYTQKGQLSS